MVFSVKWAGVSVAYVGMIWGAWMMARLSPGDFSPSKLFGLGVGMLGGGGAALPFVVTNFVAALLADRLAQGHGFATQFGAFAALSLLFGGIVLRAIDRSFGPMGGLHLSGSTLAGICALAAATFALAVLLMRVAPAR